MISKRQAEKRGPQNREGRAGKTPKECGDMDGGREQNTARNREC